jgi:hypothetical protein
MTDIDVEVRSRLAQLREEYQTGEAKLHDLLRHESALRETLLRISGAVQILEEVVEAAATTEQAGTASSGAAGEGREDRDDRHTDAHLDGASSAELFTVP